MTSRWRGCALEEEDYDGKDDGGMGSGYSPWIQTAAAAAARFGFGEARDQTGFTGGVGFRTIF